MAFFSSANWSLIGWLALVGLALAAVGLLAPKVLKPVFVGLMLVALPIGMVIGELSMALIYFGVFLPIGLCFRLIGRDALQLKLDRNAQSYWQAKSTPRDVASYYRQS